MALKANFDFSFVGRDEAGFLKNYVHDFFREYGEKSGQVFINVEIQNNPAFADEISSSISDVMEDVFFRNVDQDPYERFEVALKAVNEVINSYKNGKHSGYIGNLNILISAIVKNEIFLSKMGDSHAYLVRNKYVGVITDGLGDDVETDVFSDVASGQIDAGDFILLSSVDILKYVSKADLASVISGNTVSVVLSGLGDIISTEIMNRVCLVGIEMENVNMTDNLITEAESVYVDDLGSEKLTHTEDLVSDDGMKSKISDVLSSNLKKSKKTAVSLFSSLKSSVDKTRNSSGSFDFSSLLKNKLLLFLVGFIVALFILIMIFGHSTTVKSELKDGEAILDSVDEIINDAETKGAINPSIGAERLDEAYAKAVSVLESGHLRDRANLALERIAKSRDKFNNVVSVESPFKLADLTSVNPLINAIGFVFVNDKSYVFDSGYLYSLILDQVGNGVPVLDNEVIVNATSFDDRGSIVFLTKSGKFIEFIEGVMSYMDTDDGSFHKGVALADWSSKIYMLDSSAGQIWKHLFKGTLNKFVKAVGYFNDTVDLTNAIDLAIDGSIYVLMPDGVLHFNEGSLKGSDIVDAPSNLFVDPVSVFTTNMNDYLYVVDAGTSRVIVMKKTDTDLLYIGQYKLEGVSDLRDVYVDSDEKKMQVLTSDSVYEVDLAL